jgi:hypothetical protein
MKGMANGLSRKLLFNTHAATRNAMAHLHGISAKVNWPIAVNIRESLRFPFIPRFRGLLRRLTNREDRE